MILHIILYNAMHLHQPLWPQHDKLELMPAVYVCIQMYCAAASTVQAVLYLRLKLQQHPYHCRQRNGIMVTNGIKYSFTWVKNLNNSALLLLSAKHCHEPTDRPKLKVKMWHVRRRASGDRHLRAVCTTTSVHILPHSHSVLAYYIKASLGSANRAKLSHAALDIRVGTRKAQIDANC